MQILFARIVAVFFCGLLVVACDSSVDGGDLADDSDGPLGDGGNGSGGSGGEGSGSGGGAGGGNAGSGGADDDDAPGGDPSKYAAVVPGGGWTGLTTPSPASVGSSGKVGGAFEPIVRFEAPQLLEIRKPYVLWIHAYHTGERSDFQADGHPTFGIDHVSVAADGGAWLDIDATYNDVGKYWAFPVTIDPSKWDDGEPDLGDEGVRTLRIIAWPKNGKPAILQDEAGGYDQSFRFSTNAGGTLSHPVRYLAKNGNDSNSGRDAAHALKTTEAALASIGSEVGGAELIYGEGHWDIGATTSRTTTRRYLTVRAADGLDPSDVVFDASATFYGLRVPFVHVKGVTQTLVFPCAGDVSGHLWMDDVISDRGEDWVRVADPVGMPFALSGSNRCGLAYFTGGVVTNYANAFMGAQMISGTHVGVIASDLFTNARMAVNVTTDRILSGASYDAPPNQGGTQKPNFHPDMAQYYGKINVAGSGWFAGAILVNTTVIAGDAQGPFFKDSNYIRGIFIIDADWTMTNTGRNAFIVAGNNAGSPTFDHTILQNSMFWNSTFGPGNASRGSGECEDVIFHDVTVNGGLPAGAVDY